MVRTQLDTQTYSTGAARRCKRRPSALLTMGAVAIAVAVLLGGCQSTLIGIRKASESIGGIRVDDAIPELAATARQVRAGEEDPLWRYKMRSFEVDQMVPLPDGRVLAGLVDLHVGWGFPSYGPLVLLDQETGREIWRYDRANDMERSYHVVTVEPVIVIAMREEGETTYLGIDPAQGKRLWRLRAGEEHVASLGPDGVQLLIAEPAREEWRIRAHALGDGSARWERSVDGAVSGSAQMALFGEDVLLHTDRLTAFSAADGTPQWSAPLAGGPAEGSAPVVSGSMVVIPTDRRTLAAVTAEGSVVFTAQLDAPVGVITPGIDQLFVHLGSESQDAVAALDAADGNLQWRAQLPGRLDSNIAPSREGVYLAVATGDTDRLFLALNTASGERQYAVELSRGTYELPAHIRAYPEHAVLVGEMGVTAFAPSGAELWSHAVSPGGTYSDAAFDYATMLERSDDDDGRDSADAVAAGAAAAAQSFQSSNASQSLLQSSLSHQQWVYSSTDSLFSSSSGSTRSERDLARAQRMAATERTMGAMKAQHAAERRQAALGLQQSALALTASLYEAAEQQPQAARAARTFALMRLGQRAHQDAVQGDYFVRSNIRSTEAGRYAGVKIVDLRTGRHQTIATSAHHFAYGEGDGFTAGGLELFQPTLDPENGRLFTKGTGLAPDNWEPIAFGTDRVVWPSILSYDFESIELHSPEEEVHFGAFAAVTPSGDLTPIKHNRVREAGSGLALVAGAGSWGYASLEDGTVAIEPKYLFAEPFNDYGFAVVFDDDMDVVIDSSGETVSTYEGRDDAYVTLYPPGPEERILVEDCLNILCGYADEGDRVFFVDLSGRKATPDFGAAKLFSDGLAAAKGGDKWGYIDTNGEWVVQPQYGEADPFSEGLAFVEDKENFSQRYVLDKNGTMPFALNERAEPLAPFQNGLAPVEQHPNVDFYYVRHNGSRLHGDWDCGRGFSDGRAAVVVDQQDPCLSEDGSWGFIDTDGNGIVEPQYSEVGDFSEGLAAVRDADGLWGYIDKSGRWAIEPQFSKADPFDSGHALVVLPGKRWF